jgi:hypothetical protein
MTRRLGIAAALLAAWAARGAPPPRPTPWEPTLSTRLYDARILNETSGESAQAFESLTVLRLTVGARADWDSGAAIRLAVSAEGFDEDEQERSDIRGELTEAALSLDRIAYSPISAALGRFSIDDGRGGLLFSGRDDAWRFDGLSLRYDAWPTTLEAAGFAVAEWTGKTPLRQGTRLAISHDPESVLLQRAEAFAALFGSGGGTPVAGGAAWTLAPAPGLSIDALAAYQDGRAPDGRKLSAWIADAALRADPASGSRGFLLRWTWASGSEREGGKADALPLFDEGVGGPVLSPALSNLHLFEAGASLALPGNRRAGLSLFWYLQDRPRAGPAGQNRLREPGLQRPADGESRRLGAELAGVFATPLGERITWNATAGIFWPGPAYEDSGREPISKLRTDITWVF